MSVAGQGIANEINRIKDAVTESYDALRGVEASLGRAYDAIASMGGTVPENKTIENLTQAITTVSGGGGSESEDIWWSPKMLSNMTSAKQTLAHPELQEKAVTPTASVQTVTPDDSYDGLSKVTVGAAKLQEKIITPTTTQQTVVPDENYYGFSQVTVNAAAATSLQEKTASPSATQQIVTPDESYDGLSKVTIGAAALQTKSVTPSSSQQVITPDSNYYGLSQVTVDAAPVTTPSLQTKTVSPSTSSQTVTPDSGYDGLSKVTVGAAALQSKSVSPSTSSQTVTPGSGYYGLSQVSVSAISLQSKSVTPTKSSQTVSAGSGYDGLSQVTVNAIPSTYISTTDATATAEDIAEGKTAYVNGSKVTGTATITADTSERIPFTITRSSNTRIYVYYLQPNGYVNVTQLGNGGTHTYNTIPSAPIVIMTASAGESIWATPQSGQCGYIPSSGDWPDTIPGKTKIGAGTAAIFPSTEGGIIITSS